MSLHSELNKLRGALTEIERRLDKFELTAVILYSILIYGNTVKQTINIMEADMRNKAIVSERGTVTIPEQIRELARIHPGDLIEFLPKENFIILRHLIVTKPEKEFPLTDNEWKMFDRLVQRQLKKGHYTSYTDLDKARQHSRKLLRK